MGVLAREGVGRLGTRPSPHQDRRSRSYVERGFAAKCWANIFVVYPNRARSFCFRFVSLSASARVVLYRVVRFSSYPPHHVGYYE
jgi:hypothetical protein